MTPTTSPSAIVNDALRRAQKVPLVRPACRRNGVGERLLNGLSTLCAKHPHLASNARGKGLMLAIDLPDGTARDAVVTTAFENGLLLLGCGSRGVRFCPSLNITAEEVDTALEIADAVLAAQ